MSFRFTRLLLFLSFTSLRFAHAQIDPSLLRAISKNDAYATETALKAGANPNAIDKLGATPLMWACFRADTTIVKLLIKAGANTNCHGVIQADSSTYFGNLTGLAAGLNKLPLLRYLIETLKLPINQPEYNPQTQHNDGWTPLEWAAANGHLAVLTYLTQQGANLHVGKGNPMMLAVANKQMEVILYLLEKGETLQKDNPLFVQVLISYTELLIEQIPQYENQGRDKQAILLYEQLRTIYTDMMDKKDNRYALIISNLANLYRYTDQYEKALPLYLEGLAIREKIIGKNHPDYIFTLVNLAQLYQSTGQYKQSLMLYTESLALIEKVEGKENPDYANTLVGIGSLYRETGEYEKALPLFVKGITIIEQIEGRTHSDYATALTNLAVLYKVMGQYENALPLDEENLVIQEKVHGKTHADYVTALNNLASTYHKTGQYKSALTLYHECLKIRSQLFGKTNLGYANTLGNVAVLYQQLNKNEAALSFLQDCLTIKEQILGKTHPDYLTTLNNLAGLYTQLGQYKVALPLYEQCLANQKKIVEKIPFNYAVTLSNVAGLYQAIGQLEKALLLYKESRTVWEYNLGKNHPDYANTVNMQAMTFEDLGQYKKAALAFSEGYAVNQKNLLQLLGYTSQQQQTNFLEINKGNFVSGYSFALRHHHQQPELSGWAYNNALFYNALLLNAGQSLYRALEQSSDTIVRKLFGELKRVKTFLAVQYSRPIAQRNGVEQLEKQAESLEQELTRRSQAFRDIRTSLLVKWPQVQKALKPNEAAIEFITIPYFNSQKRQWTGTTLYAAFVIRPSYAQPKLVQLFEQTQLANLLAEPQKDTPTQINSLYRGGKTSKSGDEASESRGTALSKLIWYPLDSLLTGVNTLYLAPAGQLHRVAFAALPHPTDTTKQLSQRYQLRQVGSTRLLAQTVMNTDTTLQKAFTAQLYGGIQYSIDSVQLARRARTQVVINTLITTREAPRTGQWDYLPGTQQELDNIRRMLPQQGIGWQEGTNATEEHIKALSGHSPTLLHVATHGFFFPNLAPVAQSSLTPATQDNNSFEYSENPLLRSGLVMAGANYVWKGGKPIPGVDDGLLTALEVSSLNLSGTQLVVLSACETGLGQIQDSEGVFGLQRSFKLAGVKYILMSLWKVGDAETAEFMTHFYGGMMGGHSIRSAYSRTQAYMRGKYAKQPYKWAAFVLIE